MTLTPLKSKSDTRFIKNFFLSIKNSRKILVFISVLQLLGLPLLAAIFCVAAANEGEIGVSGTAFILISVFCLAAAVLCGIFVAVTNFSYLHKKSQVDMIYSLPIKKKYKFLSDFLSGLPVYIVPYIIGCILCNLIIMGGKICIPNLSELFEEEKTLTALMFQGEFAGMLVMIMLYTLSVLVLCCCGTLFESIMNIFMINGLIPGGIGVVAAMFFANLYGVPIFETVVPMLGYTSPIGAVIYMFYVLETQDDNMYNSDYFCINGAAYGKWVILFLAFTILYFILSMFLYHKRKAEDVSKPYAFKLLYYILITVVTMAISLFARFDFSTVFPVIIFSLIIYMIFEVITNRGFKKIYKSFIRYGVTMTAILILCVTATGTHGFGVESKTYTPSAVSSVEVNYSGIDDVMMYNNADGDWYYYDGIHSDGTIEYKEKEVIEKVIDVQKQAIDTYQNGTYDSNSFENGFYDAYYYDYYDEHYEYENEDMCDWPIYDITFKFHLKTGGTTTRNYKLSFNQLKQLFILDSTEELAEYKAERLIDNICYLEHINNKRTVKRYALEYSLLKSFDYTSEISLTKDEAYELKECYKQDYMDATEDELLTSRVVYHISGGFPIRESFDRTVDFIKKHSEDISSNAAYSEDYTTLCGNLYPPEGYESFGRDDITASFGYVKTMDTISHSLTNSQTIALMQYASSYYYEEKDCYVMELGGEYYVIPYEYSDKAENIYKESVNNLNLYSFEDFMSELRDSRSADDYIENYLDYDDYDYSCYDDILKAFEMRTIDYPDEYLTSYKPDENERREYNLLKKYFGFTSAEEYILYMENDGNTINAEDIEKEWEEYSASFPDFSSLRVKSLCKMYN